VESSLLVVEIYETEAGQVPFSEWLVDLKTRTPLPEFC